MHDSEALKANPQLPDSGPASTAQTTRMRLDFVDSLRALAALAVVLLHSYEAFGLGHRPNVLGDHWFEQFLESTYPVAFRGNYGVEVFIVLSGFSLMIPVARSLRGTLNGGVGRFFYRRARRLLPPYYAIILICVALALLVPGMHRPQGVYWDVALPILDPGVLISHLLLVHNANPDWLLKINPPLWSIAVEWQIYFLFPALLLIWRRFGNGVVLLVAVLYGAVPLHLGWPTFPFVNAWYVGLFTSGMVAAAICFARGPAEQWLRDQLPWGWIATGLGAVFLVLGVAGQRVGAGVQIPWPWVKDTLLGLSIAALLIAVFKADRAHSALRPAPILRLLNQPILVKLGVFSYSIYLVHAPVFALLVHLSLMLQLSLALASGLIFVIGIPLAILVAYWFYLVIERPFLNHPVTIAPAAAELASRSPRVAP